MVVFCLNLKLNLKNKNTEECNTWGSGGFLKNEQQLSQVTDGESSLP